MANSRADVLKGFQAARRAHQDAAVQTKYVTSGGRIDIYRLAADINIPVMFQDLDGLLGAYLADPTPGILITKKRPPAVQRFTCAHELGHHYLNHEESLDGEADIGFALSGENGSNEHERQADAFAFSFLMPRWLLLQNLERLAASGLRFDSASSIDQANVAYQLSLRVGCSYVATITTLQNLSLISAHVADTLRRIEPKKIKEHLLSQVMVPDWRRDVWLLTEADDGEELDAAPEDIFVVRVHEPSTAGYRTKLDELERNGFTVLQETYLAPAGFGARNEEVVIGSFPIHETVVRHDAPGRTELNVCHGRPWDPTDATTTSLRIDMHLKPPQQGLSLEERHKVMALVTTDD
jgi:Zn-dependent peptidase ImmA (M78 family)